MQGSAGVEEVGAAAGVEEVGAGAEEEEAEEEAEGEAEGEERGEGMPLSQRGVVLMMPVIGKEGVRTTSHQSTEYHIMQHCCDGFLL